MSTYYNWRQTTATGDTLRYDWQGGAGDDPTIAVTGTRHDRAGASACDWNLALVVDGEPTRFADLYATPDDDLPDGHGDPAHNKRDARATLSWWVRTHPDPRRMARVATADEAAPTARVPGRPTDAHL